MDLRGRSDLFGHELRVTETGFADEIASAASLIMGQTDEAQPVVLVRGLSWTGAATPGGSLIRPPDEDLFR
jgi:coenzyme F420-0:L-glutamate ligase/coenzyme F420-1:gamma-L-glutamate ligase